MESLSDVISKKHLESVVRGPLEYLTRCDPWKSLQWLCEIPNEI